MRRPGYICAKFVELYYTIMKKVKLYMYLYFEK